MAKEKHKIKNITIDEALKIAATGQDVKALNCNTMWTFAATTLRTRLKDCMFFVDVPFEEREDSDEEDDQEADQDDQEAEHDEPAEAEDPPKKEGPPAPVNAEKQKKKGGRKPLDWDKIKALVDAGWCYQKIAEEMNCSSKTIYNFFHGGRKGNEVPE